MNRSNLGDPEQTVNPIQQQVRGDGVGCSRILPSRLQLWQTASLQSTASELGPPKHENPRLPGVFSYGRCVARTRDPLLVRQVLSQLS